MLNGIKTLKFGVEDIEKSKQYLDDFGLKSVDSDIEGAFKYTLINGSEVYVYDILDTRLPQAFEAGSTLREVTWAVNRQQDIEYLAQSLKNEPGYSYEDGVVRCLDPNGMALVFREAILTPSDKEVSLPLNQYGQINRVNQPSPVYEKAMPVAIGHVVFFTPDIEKTQKFYEDKLGFYLSDAYKGRGAFMRCAAEGWHHDLFLLKLPTRETTGLNHVAFVVRDIHEVIGGGLNMNRLKWDSFIGPGRHPVSSAYFWYVHSPLGGAFEYYTNDDYVTPAWTPRIYDYALELFTEWAIEGGIDSETRRQVKKKS